MWGIACSAKTNPRLFLSFNFPEFLSSRFKLTLRVSGKRFPRWLVALGLMLLAGCGGPDPEEVLSQAEAALRAGEDSRAGDLLRPLAESGNAVAQDRLGVLFETGRGLPLDDHEACAWYQRAARQGFASAQAHLGKLYFEGRGCAGDPGRARELFIAAAIQEHPGAQYNLGIMYLNGEGVERDDATARGWFLKAARHADAHAQLEVALLYLEGRGGSRNPQEGMRWMEQAAANGSLEADFYLPLILGESGVQEARADEPHLVHAREAGFVPAKYLAQILLSSDPNACYNLGLEFLEGSELHADPARARAFFLTAAKRGHPEACKALGAIFEFGKGVEKSPSAAADWYEKAGASYLEQERRDLALAMADAIARVQPKSAKGRQLRQQIEAPGMVKAK